MFYYNSKLPSLAIFHMAWIETSISTKVVPSSFHIIVDVRPYDDDMDTQLTLKRRDQGG